jgi:hypothetical protein
MIAAVLYGGWRFFLYTEKVKEEQQQEAKQAESQQVNPDQLMGMSPQLEASFKEARKQGTAATRTWFRNYGHIIHDPKKAWIELDFCMDLARENPAEARKLYLEVKDRTPASSPVWARIQSLKKTYE